VLSIFSGGRNGSTDFVEGILPVILYFVGPMPDGPVKIGITSDLDRRLLTIRAQSPISVDIFGVMDGNLDVEVRIHERFRHLRRHYEWFTLDDEMRQFIADHCRVWHSTQKRRIVRPRSSGMQIVCSKGFKAWAEMFAGETARNILVMIDLGARVMAEESGSAVPIDLVPACRHGDYLLSCGKSFVFRPEPLWREWFNGLVDCQGGNVSGTARKSLITLAQHEGFPGPPVYR
jgi:hypothetical protein